MKIEQKELTAKPLKIKIYESNSLFSDNRN